MKDLVIIVSVLLLIIYIVNRILDRMDNKSWERIRKEREEREKLMWSRFTNFFYSGKCPFLFDEDCYIYVENHYDERINRIIETHLDEITKIFEKNNFRFLYIPRWEPDLDLLPYAFLGEGGNDKIKRFIAQKNTAEYTRFLCKALGMDYDNLKSGIFHFACYMHKENCLHEFDKSKYTVYSLEELREDNARRFFMDYCNFIVEMRQRPNGCFFSMKLPTELSLEDWIESIGDSNIEISDYRFPEDMKDIADDIKCKIERLKDGGYYELLLHTLGSDMIEDLKNVSFKPKLSRLQITDDFRILLCDYNKEIHLTPLQKALYIFYLRHPEGVEFKFLSLYYNELLAIYMVLSNRENAVKQQESIRRLVNSLDNAINEKCSRIKEAFLKEMDDFIARNYYITSETKEKREKERKNHIYCERLKQIRLPRELVSYPKEIERISILHLNEEKEQHRIQMKDENEAFIQLTHRFNEKGTSKKDLIEEFTEFTKPPKLRYKAYFYRAILYTHVGLYEEALADNQLLIDRNPNAWAEAMVNKAETLLLLKRYDEAIIEMDNYTKYRSKIDDREFFLIRSKIYDALDRTEEAEADRQVFERMSKEKKKR